MSSVYQEFLDRAIKEGVAPGLQAVVFDKKSVIFNGVSGNAAVDKHNSESSLMLQLDMQPLAYYKICTYIIVFCSS